MKRTSLLVSMLAILALMLMLVAGAQAASVSCSGVTAWAAGGNYTVGELVTYQGSEYKCLQANSDAASNWDPVDWPAGWSLVGTCGGSATPTPTATKTPTPTSGCTPTSITPYIQVGSGSWQQTSSVTVSAGSSLNLGPQPTSGTWSWTGPNGYSSTSRQIAITVNATSTYTAKYTNSCGSQSTMTFTITVTGSPTPTPVAGCTPTAITPYIWTSANGWQSITSISVSSGTAVDLGPQPVTGGSWSWSGPNGYSSTSREIDSIPLSSGTNTFTATYTNSCGSKSTQSFTISVSGSSTPTPTPVKTPTPCQSNCSASGFIFSPYKDVTVDANWNTGEQQSTVTGTSEAVTAAMPNQTLTWAFATGTCGSENWAGISPALEASNIAQFTNSGKHYIISTGGEAGSFDCPSASGLVGMINTYNSSSLVGVDFDIENGSTQIADDLVSAAKGAESSFPNLRFSFTLSAFGSTNANPIFNQNGVEVMSAMKSYGLGGNYTVNPMSFDFGAANPTYCVVLGGVCEMGQSAIAAVEAVNQQYGIPYGHIEVTIEVPTDDGGASFTMSDVSTLCSWLKSNGAAGIHYWSFDRDTGVTYANAIKSACGTN